MWGRIGLVVAGVGAGVLIAVGLRLGSAPEGEVPVPSPAAAERAGEKAEASAGRAERRSALAEALQAEVEARRQLADEVAWLREEVTRLAAELAAQDRRRERVADAGAEAQAEPGAEGPPGPADGGFFDEQALIEQGVDPDRAAWLHEKYEELEMERLYLGDEAAREGWLFTPRHRLASQAAEQRLIDEIGEEAYDQMLFAAGRNNRVRVGDVLSGSPASQAGIQPGDVVLSYGRRRIFQPRELRQETTRGEAGELTEVEVLRDGRVVTTQVPRGPLGLRLIPESQPPLGG